MLNEHGLSSEMAVLAVLVYFALTKPSVSRLIYC